MSPNRAGGVVLSERSESWFDSLRSLTTIPSEPTGRVEGSKDDERGAPRGSGGRHWLTPAFLRRLETLQLSVRWVRGGSRLGGRFPMNRRGSSIEFAEHAPYAAGDDIRAIDWNLYARLDRLFVKTYKEEIELSVDLFVDATASMALPTPEKFERATQLAVCLGYIALAGRHYVRWSWVQPGPLGPRPSYFQRRDLPRLLQEGERGAVRGQTGLADWTRRAAAQLRLRGGQVVLITDGMHRVADFFRAMHLLRVRNLEVKIVQVLSPQELHPARLLRGHRLVDAETGAVHQLDYAPAELERAVLEHNEQLVRFCKRHGILFVQHHLDEPLESFVMRTLPRHRFLE